MDFPETIGRYYQALGVLSVATTILSVTTAYWTDSLHLDLSFIIWFWLGSALRDRSRAARKWAIGISAVFWIALIGTLLFIPEGKPHIGSMEFSRGELGYYLAYAALFFLTFPGLLLLLPKAREQFKKVTEPGEVVNSE